MTQKVLWINRVNVVMSNLIFTGISADNNSVFENHSILINWGFSTTIEEQWELSNRESVIVWLAWATSGHVTDGLEISTFCVTALSEITSTAFHKKLDFLPLTSTNIKLKRFVFLALFGTNATKIVPFWVMKWKWSKSSIHKLMCPADFHLDSAQ